MSVRYSTDARPTAAQYIALLEAAGIAHRRPVDRPEVIQAALDGSQVVVTAWDGDELVGALRAITDFHLHCYVGEIAVQPGNQRGGIGLEMQRLLRNHLGPDCKIKLSSTREAVHLLPAHRLRASGVLLGAVARHAPRLTQDACGCRFQTPTWRTPTVGAVPPPKVQISRAITR